MDNSNNIDDFEDFDDIEKRDFEKYQDEYGAEFDEEKGYVKDEADEWLEKAEGGNKDILQEVEKLSIYGNSEDNNIEEGIKEYKGNEHNTSSLVLQLENFSKLEPRQVKFAYDLLTEPSLIGTKSKRLNSKSTREVVKKFNSSIGGRLDEFTRELNSIVKKADRGATPGQEVRSTNVSYEQKMIFDMISLSVEKEEAGPGSRLLGYNLSSETDEKDKADLLWFNKRLTEIAHLYNRDSTKEQDPELYEKRISATEKELTKYLMVGHPGQVMKDYSTGLDLKTLDKTGMEVEWFESTSVPLPSDLDVRGLKTLQGRSMGAGSPHTRLSFAALFPHQDDLTLGGTVKFNEQAYLDSEASKFSEKELMQLAPSIKNTLFNPREVGRQNLIETRHDIDVDDWNKDYVFSVGRKVATEKFEELKTDMRKMSKIVRKLTVTVADEENGNNLRLLTGISEQNRARREAIDNAYIYDISHDKVKSEDILLDIDRNAEYRMGATNKGSDKGGMYNDEGMSYTDQFIELIESGVSAEEAATILNIDSTKKINRNVKEEDNIESDQERYLQRVGKGLEEGKYFKQGTEEWKEQRKGKITA
ncbi:MAG: hypothetical protein KAG91_01765, partial [Mycoplasmataceae bacterium]|nr:hypothetical protein [Mycoplasmataceae bacterium]